MQNLFIYCFHKLLNVLLAPFYFHFGHHWWFIELMVIFADVTDTVFFYYFLFFLVAIIAFFRNAAFQVFIKKFYKNYIVTFNTLPLSVYFSMVFTDLLSLISFLANQFSKFFKKK